MLTIFRRHLRSCKHSKKGRSYRACGCPLPVEGLLEGKMIRRSLDIRSWEAAQKIIRDWEAGGLSKAETPTVQEAMERFIADLNSRGLSREHLRKAELLCTSDQPTCKRRVICDGLFLWQKSLELEFVDVAAKR